MERVTCIGGFFFPARDSDALARWYQERLGTTTVPQSYGEEAWRQQEGERVHAPFPQDSEMISPPEHTGLMLLLRPLVELAPLRWAVGVTGGVLMTLSFEVERRARVAAGGRSTWRGAWYPMIAGWLLMFSAEWWSPDDARLFWGLLGASLVLLLVGLQRQRLL